MPDPMNLKDPLTHILQDVLLMDYDDVLLLQTKRLRSTASLRHLTFERLESYRDDGTLYDGDYAELRLFIMYLAIYAPTHEDLWKLTHLDWENIDHIDLEERFEQLRKLPRTNLPAPMRIYEPGHGIPKPYPDRLPEKPYQPSVHSGVSKLSAASSSDYSSHFSDDNPLGSILSFKKPATTVTPSVTPSATPRAAPSVTPSEHKKEPESKIEKKSKPLVEEKKDDVDLDENSVISDVESKSFGSSEEDIVGYRNKKESLLEFSDDENSAGLEEVPKEPKKKFFFFTVDEEIEMNSVYDEKGKKDPNDDDSSFESDDSYLDIRTFRAMEALRTKPEYIYTGECDFFPGESDDEGDDDSDRTNKKINLYDKIIGKRAKITDEHFSVQDVRQEKEIENFAFDVYKTPNIRDTLGLHGVLRNKDEYYLDFIMYRRWKGENEVPLKIEGNDYTKDLLAGLKTDKVFKELEPDSEEEEEMMDNYEESYKLPFEKERTFINYAYSEGFLKNQRELEEEREELKRQNTLLNRIRRKSDEFINDSRVQNFLIFLIVVNCVMMGIGTYDWVTDNEKIKNTWDSIDTIFLVIFTIELCFQFAANGVGLFLDGWLLFDFSVVFLSWLSNIIDGGNLQVLRAFRIFRALRLIVRIKPMKDLVTALLNTLPSMVAILVLLAIVIYIFSVMFTMLYKDLDKVPDPDPDIKDIFADISETMFTLFQLLTLDGFAEITRPLMRYSTSAWVYVISYIIVSGFIVMNLVIAVICDAVAKLDEEEEKEEPQIVSNDDGIIEILELKHIDLDLHLNLSNNAVDKLELNMEKTKYAMEVVFENLDRLLKAQPKISEAQAILDNVLHGKPSAGAKILAVEKGKVNLSAPAGKAPVVGAVAVGAAAVGAAAVVSKGDENSEGESVEQGSEGSGSGSEEGSGSGSEEGSESGSEEGSESGSDESGSGSGSYESDDDSGSESGSDESGSGSYESDDDSGSESGSDESDSGSSGSDDSSR